MRATSMEGYRDNSSIIACTVNGEPPMGGGRGPTINILVFSSERIDFIFESGILRMF